MIDDKFLERDRYDRRAQVAITELAGKYINEGADSFDLPIRAPYLVYESFLHSHLCPSSSVLEIGAGTGPFTGVLLRIGAKVCATDISPRSLEVLERRHQGVGCLETHVVDMECLPFSDEKFDMVTSAGSLSYGNNLLVMNEVFRVLKPGGVFVCVDSLNHNPIYRFNRWVHYLRGNRTLSTLIRMPKVSLIDKYALRFGSVETQYFGAASWTIPLFARLFGDEVAARISDWVDQAVRVRKSAFKFVMIARKKSSERT